MAYETLYQGSDYSSDAEEDLKLHIYPNSEAVTDVTRDTLASALETFCEQILGSLIYAYSIRMYDQPRGFSTGIDAQPMHDYYWEDATVGDKSDVEGVHLLTYYGPASEGFADSPSDEGAWMNSHAAVVCLYEDNQDTHGFGALAIHETLHPLINKKNTNVEDMIRTTDSTYSHEHDLARVDTSGFVSPLGTGYVNEKEGHVWHGECSSDASWLGGYKHNISSCTESALCYTSRNTC